MSIILYYIIYRVLYYIDYFYSYLLYVIFIDNFLCIKYIKSNQTSNSYIVCIFLIIFLIQLILYVRCDFILSMTSITLCAYSCLHLYMYLHKCICLSMLTSKIKSYRNFSKFINEGIDYKFLIT